MKKNIFFLLSVIGFSVLSQNSIVEKTILSVKSLGDAKIAEALTDSSFAYRFNKPELALEFARRAIPFTKTGDEREQAAPLFYMATAFHIIGTYDSALVYYQKAEKLYLVLENPKLLGSIYLQIALLFSDSKDDVKAVQYTFKSLTYFYKSKDTTNIAGAYSNLGIFYSNTDSILKYQVKALNILKQQLNVKPERKALSLSIAYTNIGGTYQKQKKFSEALYYFKMALEEDNKHNNFLYKVSSYENLGSCYQSMAEPRKAISVLRRAINEINNTRGYRTSQNLYKFISASYNDIKMFDSAYYFLREYTIKIDSIYNIENQEIISDMQQKYDTDKKISEIALLNKNKEVADTFRKTLYVIIGLILIVVVALVYSYVLKRRSNKNLVLKNEEINKQKHLIEEKQKEIIDSIHYAKRIQQSLLPTSKYIAKKLEDLSK